MARLLALSGGGSWSLIQARALAALFPGQSGRAILGQFDLVAGTSGGAIVLAGLLGDMTPGAIAQMFLDPVARAQLYVPVDGPASLAAAFGAGPKWSSAGKLAGLQALLSPTGAAMLSGAPVRVAMPAYDVDSHRRVVFRSYGIPGSAAPATTVALAAHASSSAPVAYFDAPAAIGGLRLWDGGVAGLTCPDMLAVRDALELGLDDLRVLSLGSATVWRPQAGPGVPAALAAQRARLDEIGAVRAMAMACVGDPPEASVEDAHAAVGGHLVRLSPLVAPVQLEGGWILPAALAGSFARLAALDMDVTTDADVALLDQLARDWIAGVVANQPVAMDPATGGCLVGSGTFAEGAAAWTALAS